VAERIYLTIVDHVFPGDAFFPALAPGDWLSDQRGFAEHPADEKNPYIDIGREEAIMVLAATAGLFSAIGRRWAGVTGLPVPGCRP
jgi:hypothetical protein